MVELGCDDYHIDYSWAEMFETEVGKFEDICHHKDVFESACKVNFSLVCTCSWPCILYIQPVDIMEFFTFQNVLMLIVLG